MEPRQVYIKRILIILGLAITAVISIAIAWLFNDNLTGRPNGFTRKWIGHNAIPLQSMANEDDIIAGSGLSSTQIYFQSRVPGLIIYTDLNLRRKQYITLNIEADSKITSRFRMHVDSPQVYIYAGNVPTIFSGNLNTPHVVHKHLFPERHYTRGVNISQNTFVIREYSKNYTYQEFMKVDPSHRLSVYAKGISPPGENADLSSDGLLHYDKDSGTLIYVHFYNNSVIGIDTNLHLIYKATTIDTVRTHKINMIDIQSGNTIRRTNAGPKRFINRTSYVNEGILYVNSMLKADNENNIVFASNAVFDTYNVKDGSYRGSFYLPMSKKKVPMDFCVSGQLLVAVFKDQIITYHIPF